MVTTVVKQASDLDGEQLNWAVAKCEMNWAFEPDGCDSYSTDWELGGPIIERKGIDLKRVTDTLWDAHVHNVNFYESGPTPLIAAMRCYVASKLGDKIEVPVFS